MAFFTNVVDLQAALSACLTVRDWEMLTEAVLIPDEWMTMAYARLTELTVQELEVMHQSIPAVPIPPRATAGHLLTLSVPGVGHSQFYRSPGGGASAYPGATSGHLTHVFSK